MRLMVILLLGIMFNSCSDDDCSNNNWVGSYIGEKTVNGITESGYNFNIDIHTESVTEPGIQNLNIDGHC